MPKGLRLKGVMLNETLRRQKRLRKAEPQPLTSIIFLSSKCQSLGYALSFVLAISLCYGFKCYSPCSKSVFLHPKIFW